MKKTIHCLYLTMTTVLCLMICTSAWADWTVQEIPLNTRYVLKPAQGPLMQKRVPKILSRCFYDGSFVSIYTVRVQPGQRYTVYESFPCDGVQRNIYLMGQTPLTDQDVFTQSNPPYWSKFPTHRSMIGKLESKWDTYRTNFTIAPDSEHHTVYIVAVFARPDIENHITIKHPSDSDNGLSDPAKRIWGTALEKPLMLKKIPGQADQPMEAGSASLSTGPDTPQAAVQDHPDSAMFSLHEAPTSGTNAPVVAYNSKVYAYLSKGDYDVFRIDFQGGLFTAASEGQLDLVADIWDVNGHSISRNGHGGNMNFRLEKELPSGTYYLCVRVMHHAGEGPYTILLGDGSLNQYKEAGR